MNLLPWHPIVVHFPLALILVAGFCLVGARVLSNAQLKTSLAITGSWNLMLGAVAIVATVATGLAAVYHLRLLDGAQHSVSRHAIWAVCTSQLVILLALWRGIEKKTDLPPNWVFLVSLLIACCGLVVTGYYGGENVYHFGINVRSP